MSSISSLLIDAITNSPAQNASLYLLRNIPGFPPIIQTIHILGIAAIMGNIIFLNLRILGLAVPSQKISEMSSRLMPWFWSALLCNAISGSVFIFANPARYFNNPVFAWKLSFLVPAILLAIYFQFSGRLQKKQIPRQIMPKFIAAVSLGLWIMVAMAGRWIAYAEYLYYPA